MPKLHRILKEIGEDAFSAWQRLPDVGSTVKKDDLFNILRDIEAGDFAGHLGLRSIQGGEPDALFKKIKPSKKWVERDGEYVPTRFNAAGPSAISLDAKPIYKTQGSNALDVAEQYSGNKFLLRSDDLLPLKSWNADNGEIVMDAPRVLAGFAPKDSDAWIRILGLGGGALGAGSLLGSEEAQAAPHFPISGAKNMERMHRAVPVPDIAAAIEPRMISPSSGALSPDLAAWAKAAEKAQALEEPSWSPSDLFVAPIGAVGLPAKAAAMALDAPVSLALSEVLDYLGSGANAVADWWRK